MQIYLLKCENFYEIFVLIFAQLAIYVYINNIALNNINFRKEECHEKP